MKQPSPAPAATPQAAELPPFDKYYYYLESVQSPEADVEFLDQVYRDAHGKKAQALVMREDFCGTFSNCCEWIKLGSKRQAHGVDLDPEPLAYGREKHRAALTPAQQKRLGLHQANVLGKALPKADIICALNFSYFCFKDRKTLKEYFKNCLRTLEDGGVLVVDCFGGTKCYEPNEEETEYDDKEYSYFWDQDGYDPLTNEAMFHIHFKRKGERKRTKVFTYDWRMWSVPEIKDIMLEVGFDRVSTYWEGTTEDGEGDGNFYVAAKGDDCDSWVSYVAAIK